MKKKWWSKIKTFQRIFNIDMWRSCLVSYLNWSNRFMSIISFILLKYIRNWIAAKVVCDIELRNTLLCTLLLLVIEIIRDRVLEKEKVSWYVGYILFSCFEWIIYLPKSYVAWIMENSENSWLGWVFLLTILNSLEKTSK